MSRPLTRVGAIIGAAALTLGALSAPAAAAPPDDRAANWLAKQLTDGVVHNDQYDFDDFGLTIDVAFALQETRGHRKDVRAIKRAVRRNVAEYTTGVAFGSDDVYAGATAKALVFAQSVGADPRRFGGTDLVKQLNRRVSTAAATKGRLQDKTEWSDSANVIGQAYAARGLARAGAKKAGSVARYLLKQQCRPGFFRLNFAEAGAAQRCDAGDRGGVSAPDVDATAVAVLALQDVRQTRAVRKATARAARWLERRQRRNGSLGGGTSTEKPNANSTGLAGWALGSLGRCGPARDAARWLKRKQVGGQVGGTPLAGEKGAVAYDGAALRAARTDGITPEARDQWRRATAQAAPALVFANRRAC